MASLPSLLRWPRSMHRGRSNTIGDPRVTGRSHLRIAELGSAGWHIICGGKDVARRLYA